MSGDIKQRIASMRLPAMVFDTRNILNHDELQKLGFNVLAVGRVF